MPKIKDLGIKVIPETMKPPEIGPGGGCTDCTQQAFSICGTTPGAGGCGFTCTDCTFQQCSIAGGVTGGCTDCTIQQCSIAGGFSCTDCTFQQCSIAGGVTQQGCGNRWTVQVCVCTNNRTLVCGPSVACRLQTHCGPFTGGGGCGAISPVCAGSMDPTIFQQGGITREQIATLKDSLRKQISALEEHEKNLGPKTLEEIDAREKALNDELADLAARRKALKK